jgi:ADP-ribose pyrophosphatase YjhB (NUDIX family)
MGPFTSDDAGADVAPEARDPQPLTRSVALSITHPGAPGVLLVVRRPPDDDDLPDTWGLPAASLRDGESWMEAAHRAARDKLGITIVLGRELSRGTLPRNGRRLTMRLYAAHIREGRPRCPQDIAGVTQYVALRWSLPDILEAGARRGSLCCRLQLGWRVG